MSPADLSFLAAKGQLPQPWLPADAAEKRRAKRLAPEYLEPRRYDSDDPADGPRYALTDAAYRAVHNMAKA